MPACSLVTSLVQEQDAPPGRTPRGADVIYDRSVRQLLSQCAQELHEPFRPAEILEWFRRCYPSIKPATVRALISALSTGGPRKHEYRLTLPPVLERVDRGLYRRARSGRFGSRLPTGWRSPWR